MSKSFKDSRNEREAFSMINETCCERMMKNCDQGRDCPNRKERSHLVADVLLYIIGIGVIGVVFFNWGY